MRNRTTRRQWLPASRLLTHGTRARSPRACAGSTFAGNPRRRYPHRTRRETGPRRGHRETAPRHCTPPTAQGADHALVARMRCRQPVPRNDGSACPAAGTPVRPGPRDPLPQRDMRTFRHPPKHGPTGRSHHGRIVHSRTRQTCRDYWHSDCSPPCPQAPFTCPLRTIPGSRSRCTA